MDSANRGKNESDEDLTVNAQVQPIAMVCAVDTLSFYILLTIVRRIVYGSARKKRLSKNRSDKL